VLALICGTAFGAMNLLGLDGPSPNALWHDWFKIWGGLLFGFVGLCAANMEAGTARQRLRAIRSMGGILLAAGGFIALFAYLI